MLTKILSSRTAAPNSTILARSIPRARRFKFVQINSLRSQVAPPQRLKFVRSYI